jgi:nucleotide-binding universal stress UspA family protein
MFRKILVPLDGSPLAERALIHVQRLAPPGTAELILVTVIETYRYSYSATDMALHNTVSYVRKSTDAYLKEQRSQLEAQRYTVQTYITDGDAAQGILKVADDTGADWIAMTTHGRAGVRRWSLGSVAERVLQGAEQPVWLVRESTRVVPLHEMQRILVPLDGTVAASQAVVQAQQLAQRSGAEVWLLRAIPEQNEINRTTPFVSAPEMKIFEMWQAHAEQYLAKIAQELTATGIACHTLVVPGEPARAIFDTANTENVDCIVMTTHARHGLDRLLYGNVADEVLRRCECPMLLVHAHEWSTAIAEAQQAALA